jgi:hypothetical protein
VKSKTVIISIVQQHWLDLTLDQKKSKWPLKIYHFILCVKDHITASNSQESYGLGTKIIVFWGV